MVINWYGQTCFKITANSNGSIDLIIDPFEKEIGLRPPRIDENSIILFSDEKDARSFAGGSFVITGPGEYDIKGVSIQGVEALKKDGKKTTIYVIDAEDIKICHLGLLGQKELPAKEVEGIGDVDILMVPVGGGNSVDAKESVEVISQIEPRITIPMFYSVAGLKEKLDGLDKFLKTLGIKSPEPLEKLSVKKKDLPEDEAKIVVLQP